jgi:hypothetical protein
VISERARRLFLTLLVASLLLSLRAEAQGDPRAAARIHFDRGVAAFNDRRFGEAAEEFQAAYQISPAFVVLYNIGQVNVALGRSIEAVDAFQKYLDQGARNIPPQRRREVEAELRKQEARIGVLVVRTQPEGAEVRVDGKSVGVTPLAGGVRVTAGKHTVEALLSGYGSEEREVTAAGRAQVAVALELSRVAVPTVSPPPAVLVERRASVPVVDAEAGAGRRNLGYVIGGAGIAALAAGSVVAVLALDRAHEAKNKAGEAKTGEVWDDARADLMQAKDRNRLGWAIAGAGGALAIGGLVLALTAGGGATHAGLRVAPSLGTESGGLMVAGRW